MNQAIRRGGPVVKAALIVRNEARCLARCLNSVAPWVDGIVVVDTGSTDATCEIAAARGAEVRHFAWIDDFAAARNVALDAADADWTLVIDADEWIESGAETLRPWCETTASLGQVAIDSSFDAAPARQQTSRGWVTRLLPRGVRYEGRVHEQPISTLPRAQTSLVFGHDGYHDVRLTAKSARNRPLLLAELAGNPDDGYLLFQLGRDAGVAGDHAAAAAWYGQALDRTTGSAAWRHELVLGALDSLAGSGRLDDAMALADAEFPHWSASPDFFFVLGNLLLDRAIADPAGALEQWLPLARSAWERCVAIGERPDLTGSVAGRGSYLARHNLSLLPPAA